MKKTILVFILLTVSFPITSYSALPSDAIWEVRPTNGSNLNGACVDASVVAGTTDYSQQNAAQLSLTDLAATEASGGTTLTSATGGFTAAMVGNCIRINAGDNDTVGFYMITAYTNGNTVTIDRDCTDGDGGDMANGEGKVGGATGSVDSQTTTTLADSVVAGNTIWIKNEAWNEAITESVDGTVANPITYIGYNATRGDNPTGVNRPTNDRDSSPGDGWTNSGAYHVYYGLIMREAGDDNYEYTNDLTYGGGPRFIRSKLTLAADEGFACGVRGVTSYCNQCEIDTNGGDGVNHYQANRDSGMLFFASEVFANSGDGVYGTGIDSRFSLFYDNGDCGVETDFNSAILSLNSVYDGNVDDGLDGDGDSNPSLFLNNIFSNNGSYGLSMTDGDGTNQTGKLFSGNNNFYNNASGDRYQIFTASGDIALDPAFVSTVDGTEDYGVGTNMRAVAMPGAFPSGKFTGYLDIGAVQRQEAASGGGGGSYAWVQS